MVWLEQYALCWGIGISFEALTAMAYHPRQPPFEGTSLSCQQDEKANFSDNPQSRLASYIPFTAAALLFPYSRVVLQEVLDTDLSNEAFPFSTHKLVTAAGCTVGRGQPSSRFPREVCSLG